MARMTMNYYIDQIYTSDELSESTKTNYVGRLHKLVNDVMPNRSLHYILLHPDEFKRCIAKYKKMYLPNTGDPRHHLTLSYVNPILVIFHALEDFRAANNEVFVKWNRIYINELNGKDRLYNKPKNEDDIPITFNTITIARNSLLTGSPERLLLSFMTLITPLWSDYASIRIYLNTERPPITKVDENYIWLRNTRPIMIVMKPKSLYRARNVNEYPYLSIDLPKPLITQIKASTGGVKYLFTTKTGDKMSEGSFNQWANKVIKNLFGDSSMTLRHLRELYIIEQFRLGRTKSQMEEIGRIMGQSEFIQNRFDVD